MIFNVAVAQCQSENDLDCDDQTEDDLCSEDDGAGAQVRGPEQRPGAVSLHHLALTRTRVG